MAEIKVLVWKGGEAAGEPDVEVKVPASLAKWVPRMMALVPRKTKVELWGEQADFATIFGNLEQMINEAVAGGSKEIADIKTKESHLKILVER
jgi:hypothetical protein